jgi:dTDP-glucose 4,6-dehydratase
MLSIRTATEKNPDPERVAVTGGAGFIGSAFVRHMLAETSAEVINADKLTYAGNFESLGDACRNRRHVFKRLDICDAGALERMLREHKPDAIVNLAAETHVDRSIAAPEAFVQTNIVGTYTLLQCAQQYFDELPADRRRTFRFLHVSTDEVYGDLGDDPGAFDEDRRYAPSSPYAASKAASDHFVAAWHRTYGLPTMIVHLSNNYGPYQFPEKLIPLMIANAVAGHALPVYGDGKQVRDWLYVEDGAAALRTVLARGTAGRVYNIGGHCPRTNLDVIGALCATLDRLRPDRAGSYKRLIRFVADRPGHDRRYAVDDTRAATELGWRPREPFETGLEETIAWYLANAAWVERMLAGVYRGTLAEAAIVSGGS